MFRPTTILWLALALSACDGVGRPILGQSQVGMAGAESRSHVSDGSPAPIVEGVAAVGGAAGSGEGWSDPTIAIQGVEGGKEQDPFVSSDGLNLYFSSLRDTSSPATKIWRAERATVAEAWGEPELVEELSSEFSTAAPHLSNDGLRLWMARSDGADYMLQRSTRSSRDAPWSEPVVLGGLAGNPRGLSPSLTADELVLYFNRANSELDVDIYRAERASVGDDFGAPQPLEGLNSSYDDWDVFSWDDLSFAFVREGVLLVANREAARGSIGEASVFVDTEDDGWKSDPWVSADGNWLVYARQGDDVWSIMEVRRE